MKVWIACGVLLLAWPTVAGAEPRTAQEATVFAARHARTIGPGAKDTRYLWLPRKDARGRKQWWQVVSGWLHGQSRNAGIFPPTVILDGPQGPEEKAAFLLREEEWARAVLVRVQLSLYRFSSKVWEQFAHQHPYMHRIQHWTGGYEPTITAAPWMAETADYLQATVFLQQQTGAVVPLLRADNWFWQTAIVQDRVVGYHGLLEIKNQDDYERVIGYDPKANIDPAFFDEVLAAVNAEDSGVCQHSRRIERSRSAGGAYWRTKDNASTRNEKNDPLETYDETLRFDATEAFGHNACGFWVTGLFNAKRQSQKTAPDFIGYNKGAIRNDGRIHNGLTCFTCHDNGGLQDIRCTFRDRLGGQQGLWPQTAEYGRLPALLKYLPPVNPYLQADRQIYANALWRATGLKPQEYAQLLQQLYDEYDSGVTLEKAASDLGTTPEEVVKRLTIYLERTKQIKALLGMWTEHVPAERRGKMKREDWHKNYNYAALAIRGYVEWPKK